MLRGARLGLRRCRYYSEVTVRGATSTAMLVAMLLAAALPPRAAAQPTRLEPSFLLPVDPAWTTVLDSGPSHPPAYDRTQAYIPLRNDTVVAVDLLTGTLPWTLETAGGAPLGGG